MLRVLRRHGPTTPRALATITTPSPLNHMPPHLQLQPQWRRDAVRSFASESLALSPYWMRRAKILHILGRTIRAYPELHAISDPHALIHHCFAPLTSERERVFMYVLCQVPSDAPLNVYEFLQGATEAAQVVMGAMYAVDDSDGGACATLMASVATPDCVSQWKDRRQQVRQLLALPSETGIALANVEVHQVGLAEVKYTYANAVMEDPGPHQDEMSRDQSAKSSQATTTTTATATADARPTEDETEGMTSPPLLASASKFGMHEAMQITVQYQVTEHVVVQQRQGKTNEVEEEEEEEERRVAIDSTFTWTFDSDVSRLELMDWVVTEASRFESTVALDPIETSAPPRAPVS